MSGNIWQVPAAVAVGICVVSGVANLSKLVTTSDQDEAVIVDVDHTEDPYGLLGLRSTMTGIDAEADAQKLSGLCAGIAAIVEMDGKKPNPRLRYVVHVDDMRRTAVSALLADDVSQPKYPEFNQAIGEILSEQLPRGDDPLDAGRREAVVKLFRALSYSLR